MARQSRPNILLITTDQQRWDTLGVNGGSVLRTPNLDGMAASGVNFIRAYATTPSCIASRRTLLTGQHGATHGMAGYRDGVEFFPRFTLPQLLGDAGYQTQLIGKLHMFPQRKKYGFQNLILSETTDYRPHSSFFGENDYAEWLKSRLGPEADPNAHGIGPNSRVARPWHLAEEFHQSTFLTQQSVNWLMNVRDRSRPWFLHLSYWAPHPPLVPPAPYYYRYAKDPRLVPRYGEWSPREAEAPPGVAPDSATGPYDPEEIQDAMAGYYGHVNHLDDLIGSILRRAYTRGTRYGADERIWVIFTSDHGEMLGDHHLFRKQLPYEGSTHIPFFITGHNMRVRPATSPALVCLEDVAPTVLEMAGLPVPTEADGRSLLPILRGRKDQVRDAIYGEHSGWCANHYVVHGRHKYVWFARTNEEQLFDLENDPYETRDLSGDRRLLAPFRRLLARRLKERKDYRYVPRKLKPLGNAPPSLGWHNRP